ncbi:T-cell leukemia/lymphoma protein 1A [Peromyscus eremicus]|uniref:T-cell leukemia/lymphoma protein 1A n=1 Tax=Peromyscus eremicus TaxID=42410 RepID=UPI0027DC7AD2|nr:T-cell leukemia/lymphoma protein 1A [Peromyscus eremicus]
MAESPPQQLELTPETPENPERLWLWERHVYLDEHRRSWLPAVVKTDGKFQVLLRQESIPLGPAMTPRQLEAYELPLMWQLYPGKKYRGSDSILWKIVYHIKVLQLLSPLPPPGPQERSLYLCSLCWSPSFFSMLGSRKKH